MNDEEVFHCSKCKKAYVLPHKCDHYQDELLYKKLDKIIELLSDINYNTIDVETDVENLI